MAQFYPLEVTGVRKDTREAVVVTLAPRPEDRDTFRYTQGQYLTFRREFDGQEIRRSYSICAGRGEDLLCIGVKKVEDGCFSGWANEDLKPGDVISAMPPMGGFHAPIEPDKAKTYLGFAGGSGITPVLGVIKTVLAEEPLSNFTLVYGNRSANTAMFREDLEDLKNTNLERFSVIHILESEPQGADLFSGRVDAKKCKALFASWINAETADQVFICGPEPMMLAVRAVLREHGVNDEKIKMELFSNSQPGRAKRRTVKQTAAESGVCEATVILDGVTRVIEAPKGNVTLLDAALQASVDAPFACRAGVCSTCRAMVTEGEAEMEANFALEDYEVRRGYVLTCQSYPLTDKITFDYDK